MSRKKAEKKALKKSPGLTSLIKSINDQYGPGTIMRAGEAPSLVLDRISTGIFSLDIGIGGGWPRGRISVLKGAFSAGKSVVSYLGAANAQRCDRFTGKPFLVKGLDGSMREVDFGAKGREPVRMRVVVFDAERSFDSSWAAKWGINVKDVFVIQAEYAEQGIDVADACIRSGECDFLIVDSVAALTPSVEIEESTEKWQVGVSARLMNKALRKWTSGLNAGGLLAETKCTMLLINQMRMDLSGFKPRLTSPGGKGLDHYESIEVRFHPKGIVMDPITERPAGSEVEFYLRKNKTAPMSNGGEFQLFYTNCQALNQMVGTTDQETQVIRMAAFWKLIEKSGGWFRLAGAEKKFHGMNRFVEFIRENPKTLESLAAKVRQQELNWLETGEVPEGFSDAEAEAEEGDSE